MTAKGVYLVAALAAYWMCGAGAAGASPISMSTAKALCAGHGGLLPTGADGYACSWCSGAKGGAITCTNVFCSLQGVCSFGTSVNEAPPPPSSNKSGNSAPITTQPGKAPPPPSSNKSGNSAPITTEPGKAPPAK